MPQQKYYVVWKGVKPGIYTSWNECRRMVEGQQGALYKSFESESEAKFALESNPYKFFAKKDRKQNNISADNIIKESISVDAACSGNPGLMEYRGVETVSGKEIFHAGPFEKSTNNIGEFLAIVHGLALLKQQGSTLPLYSDSRNAMLWVQKKKCNTKLEAAPENEKSFELIQRAENWLKNNTFSTKILKWDTKSWGEIPADFGRK
jgi:ribonuclease HI